MAQTHKFAVAEEDAGARLDRFVAAQLPELSRTRIAELIDEGRVRVNGAAAKRSHRVAAGQHIEVDAAPRGAPAAQPEDIPLQVVYEDDDVVVVNKPAGMIVHAGAGAASSHGTLVNALLHRYRELSAAGDPARPGIVHRLDKDTSGVMIVARNDAAHRALAEQFSGRRVQKTYIALLHGALKQPSGRIELAIARDLKRRTRMTTRRLPAEGRAARTDWRVLARIGAYTLVEADLHTGRTHQIRVHFSALGNPVVGDALYGAARQTRAGTLALPPLPRNFLHAARICFTHPRTGKPVEARAALPGELREFLNALVRATGADASLIDAALRGYL